ncbi:MAG: trypsin-like peptidase domain-containing protein [Candidatus Magasanikbacteria bacterium]
MNFSFPQKSFFRFGALLVILFSLCGVFLFEYLYVQGSFQDVDNLVKKGEYSQALSKLDKLTERWSVERLGFLASRIEKRFSLINKRKIDKSEYMLGNAYYKNSNWSKSKKLFSKVSTSSQYYKEARKKIDKIETRLIVRSEVSKLREDFQKYKNKTKKIREKDNVSIAVARWSNFVVPVRCYWSLPDDDLEITKKGSGTIISSKDGLVEILTNRHVVTYEGSAPDRCEVGLFGSKKMVDLSKYETAYYLSKKKNDWASINIQSLPTEAYDRVKDYIKEFDPFKNICSVQVNSGDKIVVLGYPKIGLNNKITATTGIVSGKEDRFYVTDAKIDKGNSGGAAILLDNNCFLGIPTSVRRGSAESLGRVLDAEVILEKANSNED